MFYSDDSFSNLHSSIIIDDNQSNSSSNSIFSRFFHFNSLLNNEDQSFQSKNSLTSNSFSSLSQDSNNINNGSNTYNENNFISEKRKRGRRKKKNIKTNQKPRPEHGKSARDNIKTKIQVHYLKFLVQLLNEILNEIIYKDKKIECFYFYPLKYLFSKNISKNSFEKLKNTSIGDIFKENTSTKFRNPKKSNIIVYNEVIKQNDKIKNILDQKYLDFFHLYYLNIKQINLCKFGINQTIYLSSVECYEDLLKKEKNRKNYINDDTYFEKIEKCIKKDFLKNGCINMPIFLVN